MPSVHPCHPGTFFFFLSSRRRHTRLSGGLEFRRVLFRSAEHVVRLDAQEDVHALCYLSVMVAILRSRVMWSGAPVVGPGLTTHYWTDRKSTRLELQSPLNLV